MVRAARVRVEPGAPRAPRSAAPGARIGEHDDVGSSPIAPGSRWGWNCTGPRWWRVRGSWRPPASHATSRCSPRPDAGRLPRRPGGPTGSAADEEGGGAAGRGAGGSDAGGAGRDAGAGLGGGGGVSAAGEAKTRAEDQAQAGVDEGAGLAGDDDSRGRRPAWGPRRRRRPTRRGARTRLGPGDGAANRSRALSGPRRADLDDAERVHELAIAGIAATGDEIDLGEAGGLPDGPQGLDDRRGLRGGRPPGPAVPQRPVAHPDGVLAVVARDAADLLLEAPRLRAPGCTLPRVDRLHVFLRGSRTHDDGGLDGPGTAICQIARYRIVTAGRFPCYAPPGFCPTARMVSADPFRLRPFDVGAAHTERGPRRGR